MDKKREIKDLARRIYLLKPFWKHRTFRKWMKSNNWDVKHVYADCIDEAKMMIHTEEHELAAIAE